MRNTAVAMHLGWEFAAVVHLFQIRVSIISHGIVDGRGKQGVGQSLYAAKSEGTTIEFQSCERAKRHNSLFQIEVKNVNNKPARVSVFADPWTE